MSSPVLRGDQLGLLAVLERVGGSLSLFALILVLLSYARLSRLRTLPSTLLVYASGASAAAAVASLIADAGVRQGPSSPLCQAQGALLELFMLAAPSWALALAVSLVLSSGTSPSALRKWAWLCCLPCYGGPLCVALAFLFLTDARSSPIYSNTDGWCWISREWQAVRLYGCYVPAWAFILLSVTIYFALGLHSILRARVASKEVPEENTWYRPVGRTPPPVFPRTKKSFLSLSDWPLSPHSGGMFFGPEVAHLTGEAPPTVTRPMPAYPPAPLSPRSTWLSNFGRCPRPAPSPPLHRRLPEKEVAEELHEKQDQGSMERAHLQTGVLFALSIIVTWIPGSLQHIWELVYNESPFGMKVATAVTVPLQGVWVAAIFFGTSWSVLRTCVVGRSRAGSPETGVSGRLEQPRRGTKGRSMLWMGQDGGVAARKQSWMPWANRDPRRGHSWDFLDVGIPGGAASFRASRGSRSSALRPSRLNTEL